MANPFQNIYNSEIGKDTRIGAFVEIGNAKIGDNCSIQAFTFICGGVEIGNHVFIGPHVCFTNDKYPEAHGAWVRRKTIVEDNVSIGANSTILPGITLGKGCKIAAGSIVTKDVKEGELWLKK